MKLPLCLTMLVAAAGLPAEDRLVEGNPRSAVRVVVYEDLQCPDCAAFRRMMDEQLLPRFAGKVAFEHRDFPLPRHNWARKAAIAARFFARQSASLGVAYRRHALESIGKLSAERFEKDLESFARSHSVDPDKALAALEDSALAAAVETDYQEGVARGIARTPTVLVNGVPFIERFPLEDLVKCIEEALAEAAQ